MSRQVSPARAINPATGRLGATLRLTPWANSLRYAYADADPEVTYIPHELTDLRGVSFGAVGLGALIYSFPADQPPTISQAVALAAEGRDALLSAASELIAKGFVEPLYIKAPVPPALRMAVLKRDGYRCVICDVAEDLMADHVIPEVKGGETTFDNLQTMCRPCNSSKGSS